VTRLLGLMYGIGDRLAAIGWLAHPSQLWRVPLDHLRAIEAAPEGSALVPLGPDRWEPFAVAVIAARGVPAHGEPVAPGIGAGPIHRLQAGAGRPGPRAVLVAPRPVPQIAPLLWGCAGLVTVGGSDGAHLFEVARSLGVPAVTSPDFADRGIPPTGAFAAVDGTVGSIAVLDELEPPGAGSGSRLAMADGGAA